MKILLHSCCAPCANKCVDTLKEEGYDPTLFWYNPNIHPFTEYKERRNGLRTYSDLSDTKLIEVGEYGLRTFLPEVIDDIDHRCSKCYKLRMDKVAKHTSHHNYDGFTTSLLISPYQNHDVIIETAQEAADKYDVKFVYKDFRPLFRKGQQAARDMGIYMQKYCGCIFSEEDRYNSKKKE